MKKLSKKKRKRKQQREAQGMCRNAVSTVSAETVPSDQPLTGMRITKKNIYEPQTLDDDLLFFGNGNTEEIRTSRILFTPAAVKQLKRCTDWGTASAQNTVEQQGVLLGSVYKTPCGYSGVVEAVLLSQAIGNPVYVESAHSDWSVMDAQMDALNRDRKRKLVKIGWWHTHPNMAVFMSGTDRDTQKNYFYKDWQFAVVLNPQEKKWAAFVGEDAVPCTGCFLNDSVFKLKITEREYDT